MSDIQYTQYSHSIHTVYAHENECHSFSLTSTFLSSTSSSALFSLNSSGLNRFDANCSLSGALEKGTCLSSILTAGNWVRLWISNRGSFSGVKLRVWIRPRFISVTVLQCMDIYNTVHLLPLDSLSVTWMFLDWTVVLCVSTVRTVGQLSRGHHAGQGWEGVAQKRKGRQRSGRPEEGSSYSEFFFYPLNSSHSSHWHFLQHSN